MTRPKPNPYELLELDPGLDLQGLTEALRERAESASAKERGQIQGIWQALTMDPKRRAEAQERMQEVREQLANTEPHFPTLEAAMSWSRGYNWDPDG